MIKYTFYREEKKRPFFLKMNFEPELVILSSYLYQVVDLDTYKWILEGINAVLSGKLNRIERETEWYGANITYTDTIFYTPIDEDNNDTDIISTEDFKTILNLWWREKELFDKWK